MNVIQRKDGTPKNLDNLAFEKSGLHFALPKGKDLDRRIGGFHEWVEARREKGVWPYRRVLMSPAGHTASVGNEFGNETRTYLNFGSQDYLGMAQDKRVHDAARGAIDEWGVHSAGSPSLAGRTRCLLELEDKLCSALHREACTVFPTGWAAGFGVLVGLVREHDTVVIDYLAHNCLQEGARHATRNVCRFAHNDLEDLARILREERNKDVHNGLFIVIESLYSMDSDFPNLREIRKLARQYDAILIVDVAHDFGAMGEFGLGLLESVASVDQTPDIIVGSFSKTFASNGGFVAASRRVQDYFAMHCPPLVFSNAISPLQVRIVTTCFELIFSKEGEKLRGQLLQNIRQLRAAMSERGLEVAGAPSPIVPIFVGNEKVARLTSQLLAARGLLANLVEFPAVAKGKARFRFQVMANHGQEAIDQAAEIMAQGRALAQTSVNRISTKD
jgi:7-keto-8-aminopelargonate synthetase-like enzyme